MSAPRRLEVTAARGRYPVWIGTGLLERAADLIEAPGAATMLALFVDEGLQATERSRDEQTAVRIRKGLEGLSLEVRSTSVGGEEAKSVDVAQAQWRWLAISGFHRNDLVVAVGGGALGDLAGFIAATYHRGMAWVVVPTTLLAMVDAAIGGKTAVNLPEGKNLVGAFHPPLAVIADVTTLQTLPEPAFATGMAEVIKHGLIAKPALLGRVLQDREAIGTRDDAVLADLVAEAAAIKVDVVSRDETERGMRAHLNYGHTLGHALEVVGGYRRWTHGEAVGIGLMFAAYLAEALGMGDRIEAHREPLAAYGLPTGGAEAAFEDVAAAWDRDKKFEAAPRFVVLEELGRPTVIGDVPEDALRAAYDAVR